MITDLIQIRRLGEQKRGENERFRRHLKTHDFVERRLRHLAEETEAQVDCTECANCCKVATARLLARDVDRLAKLLRLPEARFLKEYTTKTEDEGLVLKRDEATGCVFLSGNECTVYETRPASCRDFPHMLRGSASLQAKMWDFKDRAVYCPIVYNTLEAWKVETGFSPAAK
ncbi:MAG: YkgJ family cysteine cluster protein [Candidatus Solibacter usitatus]|nr:YkgJ family cysteine cluster protein [Candidatus Solibacter usitatus]